MEYQVEIPKFRILKVVTNDNRIFYQPQKKLEDSDKWFNYDHFKITKNYKDVELFIIKEKENYTRAFNNCIKTTGVVYEI